MQVKIIVACFTTVFFSFNVYSAGDNLYTKDAEKKEYTVEELIRIALDKYEQIKVEESKVREVRELRKHLAEWYNPELSIAIGQKSISGITGLEKNVSISQKISFPGKKSLMEEIALLEQSRAMLSTEELKLFVRYEVTRLAYEYAYHFQRKRHVADRLKRFQLIHSFMENRIVVPPEKKVEQSIVQTRIAILQKEVLKVDADIAAVCARLNLFTGFSGDSCPEIKIRWFSHPPMVNKDDLLRKAKDVSFPVRLQREMLDVAKKNKELEERIVYPDVGILLYYNDARADVYERSLGGGLSFPFPLFSRNRYAIAMAEERIRAEEQKVLFEQKRAIEHMRALIAHHEYIKAMISKFPINDIHKFEEKMRYADIEFKKGRIPLMMYLEMDSSTYEIIEEIYRLQLDLVSVLTSIRFLAGEEVLINGDQ